MATSAASRILVTGADGFIGSHLVETLVREGRAVRAFVFYNSFNSAGWLDHVAPDVAGNFEVVSGDVRDPHGVREAMRGCRIVMHLAALVGIPFSYHSPDAYVETNVRGALNVLQAARDLGVDRVVVTSTSEVYGSARVVPITEEHSVNAQSPYAATKIAADQLALAFHRSFDLPIAVLRPFNTYGPRQSARAVVPAIIGQIAAGSRKLKLGALHPTRDFSFVGDTARGFVQIADCDGAIGQVANIGSGFEISIGDVAALIAKLMVADIEIETDPERVRPAHSEVDRLLAATTKAERLFCWKPQFGGREGFSRGLAKTIEWFCDPANRARYDATKYYI
jgi:NAD dependent epimerase/dehydratase